MKKSFLFLACAILALAWACNSNKGWKVSGTVQNAQPETALALQGFNGASWYLIDSLPVDSKGAFSYSAASPAAYPDVYRILLGGKAIYFPIDSIDAIEIYTDALSFDKGYGLAGTPAAIQMMELDNRLADVSARYGTAYAATDSAFKRELNDAILRDSVGIISYYLINKTIGDRPLYDLNNRQDVKMIGAVANKFTNQFPNDPRTKYLVERFRNGRQATGMVAPMAYEAQVVDLFEIDLYDVNGVKQSLTKTAQDAGVTLLSFTSYDLDSSVAYNVELNRLYELFRPQNIAIYQVALDADEVQWMQAAKNLPWIAVRQDPSDVGEDIYRYNITTIPVTFIINGKGELVDRVDDPTQLEAQIRKYL